MAVLPDAMETAKTSAQEEDIQIDTEAVVAMVSRKPDNQPLKHHFQGSFGLTMDSTGQGVTMIPLLVSDKSMAAPEDVVTNPYHNSYAGIKEGPMCYFNSRIDKIRIGMTVAMPPAGQETGIKAVKFFTAVVALSFDDIDKQDKVGTEYLKDLIGVQQHSSGNYVEPKWNGTDLGSANDLYTDANTDFGLTTDSKIEGITWDDDNYEEARRDSTLAGLIRKTVPSGLKEHVVYVDRPYTLKRPWFEVPSNVKRMNQNTFLGLMLWCPQSTADYQFYSSGEVTNVSHLRVGYDIYFNEKNPDFMGS